MTSGETTRGSEQMVSEDTVARVLEIEPYESGVDNERGVPI